MGRLIRTQRSNRHGTRPFAPHMYFFKADGQTFVRYGLTLEIFDVEKNVLICL